MSIVAMNSKFWTNADLTPVLGNGVGIFSTPGTEKGMKPCEVGKVVRMYSWLRTGT